MRIRRRGKWLSKQLRLGYELWFREVLRHSGKQKREFCKVHSICFRREGLLAKEKITCRIRGKISHFKVIK